MLSKEVLMPSTKIGVPQKLSGTTCNTQYRHHCQQTGVGKVPRYHRK